MADATKTAAAPAAATAAAPAAAQHQLSRVGSAASVGTDLDDMDETKVSGSSSGSPFPQKQPGTPGKIFGEGVLHQSSQARGCITIDKSEPDNQFSAKELRVLEEQFREISRNGRLDRKEFRTSLGILGMVRDSLICDRLFDVFCVQNENSKPQEFLTFEQYTTGLAIMVKGTVEQKLDFGFDMIDIDSRGYFTFEDLNIIIQSLSHIFTGVMGQDETSISKSEVSSIFSIFDPENTGRVTRDQYKNTIYRYPEIVLRFGEGSKTKTERAMTESTKQYEAEKAKAILFSKTLAIVENEMSELKHRVQELGKDVATKTGDAPALQAAVAEFVEDYEESFGDIESTLAATQQRAKILTKAQKSGPPMPRGGSSSNVKHSSSDASAGNSGGGSLAMDSGGASKGHHEIGNTHLGLQRIVSVGSDHFTCLDDINLTCQTPSHQAHPFELKLSDAMMDARSLRDPRPLDECISKALMEGLPEDNITVRQAVALSTQIKDLIEDSRKRLGLRLRSSKGNAVVFGHKNWDLVMNVMQGLQLAVSRTSAEGNRPLSTFDFGTKEKYTLVPGNRLRRKSNGKLDDNPQAARFVDYSPFVWRRLRAHFGINDEEYVQSLGPGALISNLVLGSLTGLSELGSEGKSGSFFYYTSDGKYMVKTISEDEHILLKNFLQGYYNHMVADSGHRPSLLCRILGHHQIRKTKSSGGSTKKLSLFFVVMANCFKGTLSIDRRFDLKGSWVGRSTKSEEARSNPKTCLKDTDVMDMHQGIDVRPDMAQHLVRTLTRDSLFLAEHHIIDYSLLLGIHYNTAEEADFFRQKYEAIEASGMSFRDRVLLGLREGDEFYQLDDGGMVSRDFTQTYYVGIIDILTEFNDTKKAEKFVKLFYGGGVSVQEPAVYQRRFADFLAMLIGASSESFTNGDMNLPDHWRKIMERHHERAERKAAKERSAEDKKKRRSARK